MLEAVHLSSLCLDLIKPPTVHLWRLNRGTPNDPYYWISHSDWSKPVDQLAGQWRIVLHYFIQQVGDQLINYRYSWIRRESQKFGQWRIPMVRSLRWYPRSFLQRSLRDLQMHCSPSGGAVLRVTRHDSRQCTSRESLLISTIRINMYVCTYQGRHFSRWTGA